MMERTLKFKTLTGHRNLEFSIQCLNSFLRNSADNIELEIFDDGSLVDADKEKLLTNLRNSSIVTKGEREEALNHMLRRYPYCRLYRKTSNYAQKLFDVMLYSSTNLSFIDSDIFFLRKFRLPEFENVPTFMLDKQNAYSFTPYQFVTIRRPIFPRVNTGLFYFPSRYFNLDLLEALLFEGLWDENGMLGWLEQTLWAFLAAQSEAIALFDDSQIKMSRQNLSVDADTVAVHLVSSYRYHFEFLKSLGHPSPNDKVQHVRLAKTTALLHKYDFVADRLKQGIYRRIGIYQ